VLVSLWLKFVETSRQESLDGIGLLLVKLMFKQRITGLLAIRRYCVVVAYINQLITIFKYGAVNSKSLMTMIHIIFQTASNQFDPSSAAFFTVQAVNRWINHGTGSEANRRYS
jgi:hypothetical protein